MFTLSKDRRSTDSRGGGGDDERLLANNHKKRPGLLIHNLLHKPCNHCSTNFNPGFCPQCCQPICHEFINSNGHMSKSKILKNNQHNQSDRQELNGGPFVNSSSLQSIIVGQLWSSSSSTTTTNNNNNNHNWPTTSLAPPPTTSPVSAVSISRTTTPVPRIRSPSDNDLSDNRSMSTVPPSAPAIGHELFDNEKNADVIFLVGQDKNNLWRFPAHTEILKNNDSVYFSNILNDSLNNNNKEIRIDWCDPKTFQIILRYVYTEELNTKSVPDVLKLFVMSVRFSMISLAKFCLTFLKDKCNDENVLVMLKYFKNYFALLNFEKQNPTDPKMFNELSETIAEVFLVFFNVIDQNAGKIIAMDEFSMIDHHLATLILSRDTLNIVSEMDVYQAICRWADQQCKQQRKELNDKNKRDLLGDLIFAPRYLTMNLTDFQNGPNQEDKLFPNEKEMFLKKLKGGANDSNSGVNDMPELIQQYKLNIPRHYQENDGLNEIIDDVDDDYQPELIFQRKLAKSLNYENGLDEKKKRSVPRKIIKGLGEFMIFIIKVLD